MTSDIRDIAAVALTGSYVVLLAIFACHAVASVWRSAVFVRRKQAEAWEMGYAQCEEDSDEEDRWFAEGDSEAPAALDLGDE